MDLPGRTHDLTAARTHRIVATCVRLGIPALADLAYLGAGGTFATPTRRPPHRELTARHKIAEPGPRTTSLSRRTRHGHPQALAHLPSRTLQPQPPVVSSQSRPHPGETTLKMLNEQIASRSSGGTGCSANLLTRRFISSPTERSQLARPRSGQKARKGCQLIRVEDFNRSRLEAPLMEYGVQRAPSNTQRA